VCGSEICPSMGMLLPPIAIEMDDIKQPTA
jgi:hypothetical protein